MAGSGILSLRSSDVQDVFRRAVDEDAQREAASQLRAAQREEQYNNELNPTEGLIGSGVAASRLQDTFNLRRDQDAHDLVRARVLQQARATMDALWADLEALYALRDEINALQDELEDLYAVSILDKHGRLDVEHYGRVYLDDETMRLRESESGDGRYERLRGELIDGGHGPVAREAEILEEVQGKKKEAKEALERIEENSEFFDDRDYLSEEFQEFQNSLSDFDMSLFEDEFEAEVQAPEKSGLSSNFESATKGKDDDPQRVATNEPAALENQPISAPKTL